VRTGARLRRESPSAVERTETVAVDLAGSDELIVEVSSLET